jgi:DNA polymerase V
VKEDITRHTFYFDGTVPAGFPSPAADYMQERINLNDVYIQHPMSTSILSMEDTSMQDAYIPYNAKLLIDKSLKPKNGDIVLATCNGELLVRFFEKKGEGYTLIAASKDYQSICVTEEMDVRISGVVTTVFIETKLLKSCTTAHKCDSPELTCANFQKSLDLNELFNKNPWSSFVIGTMGKSMQDAYIPNKSKLLIDKSLPPQTGDIVLAFYNAGFTVKYLDLNESGCRLLPANKCFKPVIITEEMQLQIWGVVVLIIIDPKTIKYVSAH